MSNLINDCLYSFLRTFVSFCIRRGVKFQTAVGLLKQAYYDVAEDELSKEQKKVSISKIAVVTGLQRRDVKKLALTSNAPISDIDLITKVVGQWQKDEDYLDSSKSPKSLTSVEFNTLVAKVSKDLNPYTILFELERTDLVVKLDNLISLNREVFSPTGDVKGALDLLTTDLRDLVFGVEENIFTERRTPNLHITTRYDNVSKKALPKLRKWMLKKGRDLHKEVRDHLSQFDKDLNPELFDEECDGYVSFCSFSFIEGQNNESKNNKK